MKCIHYEFNVQAGDIIRVNLDKQANVRLLDPSNFTKYKKQQKHKYIGGLAKSSPLDLVPPHSGKWHVAIDLGGRVGSIKASAQHIPC